MSGAALESKQIIRGVAPVRQDVDTPELFYQMPSFTDLLSALRIDNFPAIID
jgi:hypothetical protein